jgi:hypothetical protein
MDKVSIICKWFVLKQNTTIIYLQSFGWY